LDVAPLLRRRVAHTRDVDRARLGVDDEADRPHLRRAVGTDGGEDGDLVVVEQVTVRFRDRWQGHSHSLFLLQVHPQRG